MIFFARPLTVEMTALIDSIGGLIASGDRLTEDEMIHLREWLKAARAKHHAEVRVARASGISLRRGAEIVPISDFQRAESAYAGRPCDSEGDAA